MFFFGNLVSKIPSRWLFTREESGQTLVEYGLIAVLLSIAAVVILAAVGDDVVSLFTRVSTELSDARGP